VVVPVVSPEPRPQAPAAARRPAPALDGRPASEVVGVPVRVQSERPAEAEAAARSATHYVATEDGDFWYALVQQMAAGESIAALTRELALQSQLVGRDTDHWILRVERESLNNDGTRTRLQAALQNAGHPVTLGVEVGAVTDSPARRNAHAASLRQKAAEEIIMGDAFVQQMMRDFGAKIVPGSIKPVTPEATGTSTNSTN